MESLRPARRPWPPATDPQVAKSGTPGPGPRVRDLRLVLARRELAGQLRVPEDWDGMGVTAKLLGEPAAAECHPGLDVYETLIRHGSHENPHPSTP